MEPNDIWLMDPGYPRLAELVEHVTKPRPARVGMDDLTRIDYLTEIIKEAEALRSGHVASARESGESWSAIAAQMGTTKQAAQQRFGA